MMCCHLGRRVRSPGRATKITCFCKWPAGGAVSMCESLRIYSTCYGVTLGQKNTAVRRNGRLVTRECWAKTAAHRSLLCLLPRQQVSRPFAAAALNDCSLKKRPRFPPHDAIVVGYTYCMSKYRGVKLKHPVGKLLAIIDIC